VAAGGKSVEQLEANAAAADLALAGDDHPGQRACSKLAALFVVVT
jgi:hypothetical protein